MLRKTTITMLAAIGLVAMVSSALALEPHHREGWKLGLSYGAARGKVTGGSGTDGSSGSTEDGVSPQIRIGRTLGEHITIGAAYSGWMYETGADPIKYRYAMQNIMLSATWYPGAPDSRWGGLFLRGGAGLGWTNYTIIELVEGEEQGHGDRDQESGLGVAFHLGYEWRLVRSMAVGLGLGVSYLDIGGDLTETATYFPATLNMAWYWD